MKMFSLVKVRLPERELRATLIEVRGELLRVLPDEGDEYLDVPVACCEVRELPDATVDAPIWPQMGETTRVEGRCMATLQVALSGDGRSLVPVRQARPQKVVGPVQPTSSGTGVPLKRVQVCSAAPSVPVRGVEIPALLGIGQAAPEKLPATKRGNRGLSISAALRTKRRKRVVRGRRVI